MGGRRAKERGERGGGEKKERWEWDDREGCGGRRKRIIKIDGRIIEIDGISFKNQ